MKMIGGLPAPRRASLRVVRDSAGDVVDRAVVIWLPGPASYTGEDSAELHVHGGRAVLRAVTAALEQAGARLAEPGEFSRRAFVHGRMDLLEAEGVADLVAAETEAQRRAALRQMDGEQSRLVGQWAERLRRLLAWQEALIDFPDEDLPAHVEASLMADLEALRDELAGAVEQAGRGARLREGLVFAVTGAPNVGKSSLVNALARRDVAIVSALPGTTRDLLEVQFELGGVPVTLVDTAGLREAVDPVEAEGVRRARARAAEADLVVHVVEAGAPDRLPMGVGAVFLVANKTDLAAPPAGALGVCAMTGAGLDALEAALAAEAQRLIGVAGSAVLSRARHVAALRDAVRALDAAAVLDLPELRGEELRAAMAALGGITGAVDVEAILDTVFGSFCIGK